MCKKKKEEEEEQVPEDKGEKENECEGGEVKEE
jgi:hypothetical protein